LIERKGEVINKLISTYTNNFTQPLGYRVINIGELKLILKGSDAYNGSGQILDVDKTDPPQTKYKAELDITSNLLELIKEKGFNHLDIYAYFSDDYYEMVDLEDDYGFR
jgi:hypothetical protein